MYMTDQAANEFRITESLPVSLSDYALSLLRAMTKHTGMSAREVIETALSGYSRALKESE